MSKVGDALRRLTGTRETASAPNRLLRAWLLGDDFESGSVVVNETTALGIAAYFASIRNISEDMGKLPLRFFRARKDGGKDAIPDHALTHLLNKEFNPAMSAMTGWETMMSHALGWQGGYFEIIRTQGGAPIELWPIDPRSVTVETQEDGSTRYLVTRKDGQQQILESKDVFDLHGLGFDGLSGYIIARIGKSSIGPALAANQFRFAFFQNGAIQSTVITVPETWSEKALEGFRSSWDTRHTGAKKAYKTAILEKGADIKVVGSDPEKSQLVETLKFNVEDVARWFRIPPNKIGHLEKSAFSNITEENRNYVIDTLQAWSVRICQEIQRKLLTDDKIIVEHNFGMLLEADLEKRIVAKLAEFSMGIHSTNTLLQEANKAGIGAVGDKRWILSGLQELTLAPEEPPEPEPEPDEDDPEEDKAAIQPEIMRDAISTSFTRLFRDDFERFTHVEQGKAGDAMQRNDLATWLNSWFPGREKHIAECLESRVAALLASISSDADVRELSKDAAKYYAIQAQSRILKHSRGEKVDNAERFAGCVAVHTVKIIKEAA